MDHKNPVPTDFWADTTIFVGDTNGKKAFAKYLSPRIMGKYNEHATSQVALKLSKVIDAGG
jgi:hypothetical protein